MIETRDGGHPHLTVSWSGSLCRYELNLRRVGAGYELAILQTSKACRAALVRHTFGLSLTSSLEADQVAIVTGIGEEDSLRPPRVLTCGHIGPVGGSSTTQQLPVSVVDATETIRDCIVWLTVLTGPSFAVENPTSTNESLGFSWRGTACDRSATLTFERPGTRYRLVGVREPGDCDTPAAYHATLDLASPIAAASVDASIEELPTIPATPTPEPSALSDREIECASERHPPTAYNWRPPVVRDETGVVESCHVADTPNDNGHEIVVTNPDANTRALGIVWGSRSCDAEATFVFRHAGDGFSLHGTAPHPGCSIEFARHAIVISLRQDVDAESVTASFRSPVTYNYGPKPAEPAILACPYVQDGVTLDIPLLDHSGLALTCEGFFDPLAPIEPVSATNVGSDEQQLEVRWEISAVCDPMPVQLELWGPMVYDLPFAQEPEFVVQIDELAPLPGPQECQNTVATQGVRIALASPISAGRAVLEVFRTKSGMGHDVDTVDGHALELTLTSTKAQYTAGEPIDITASILYDGPRKTIAMSGLSGNPGFGFHQLDGDVRQTEGTDWTCHDLELRRRIPITAPFRKAGVFIPDDFPNTDAENAYWSEPDLRLPPGVYRLFASAGGVIDGFCWGGDGEDPSLSVRASIVIEVR